MSNPIGQFVPYAKETEIETVTQTVTVIADQINAPTTGIEPRLSALETSQAAQDVKIGDVETEVNALDLEINEPGVGILARLNSIQTQTGVNIPYHNPSAKYKAGDVVKVRVAATGERAKMIAGIYFANADIDGTTTPVPFVVDTAGPTWTLLNNNILKEFDSSIARYTVGQMVMDNGIPYFLGDSRYTDSPRPQDNQFAAAMVQKWTQLPSSGEIRDGVDYYITPGSMTAGNITVQVDVPKFSLYGTTKIIDPMHEIGRTANTKVRIVAINGSINGRSELWLSQGGTCVELSARGVGDLNAQISYSPAVTVDGVPDTSKYTFKDPVNNFTVEERVQSDGKFYTQMGNGSGWYFDPSTRRMVAVSTPTAAAQNNDYLLKSDADNIYTKPTVGDVKQSMLDADHNGWVLLDGRPLANLTATQRDGLIALGFTQPNLPSAANRALAGAANASNRFGATVGSSSIARNNLPNITIQSSQSGAATLTSGGSGAHTHTASVATRDFGSYGRAFAHNQGAGVTVRAYGFGSITGNTNVLPIIESNPGASSIDDVNLDHNHTATIDAIGTHTHSVPVPNHTHDISLNGGVSQQAFTPLQIQFNVFLYLGQ